ncbi:hypothetical protein [Seonamhaeicola sp.]|uniref:hypothetical protein n=1 Tax=Seonamhaeicola sp. TaxID=1912245 RepID=UPI00262CF7E8|nr:hypothetical protein [Seonamhaeicola sp.]
MVALTNKLIQLIRYVLSYPLSLIRITLPVFIGKKVYGSSSYEFYLEFNSSYINGKTWFLEMLPDFVFNLDYSQFIFFKYFLIIVILCSSIGLLGRLNLLILAGYSYLLFGIGEGYGIFDHHTSLPAQVLFALALVPGSMKLSVDNILVTFIRKRKNLFSYNPTPKWGFNLVLALVAVTYFTAGLSKIRYGGLKWMDGSTLSFYLKERTDNYAKQGEAQLVIGDATMPSNKKWKDPFGFVAHTYGNYQTVKSKNAMADYVANNGFLVALLSIGSLLFELLAFIVFINSRYRNMFLITAILFHLSIGELMGISFRQYRLICLFLIDWKLIFDTVIGIAQQKKLKLIRVRSN